MKPLASAIEREPRKPERRIFAHRTRPPQQRPHARQQLPQPERLHQIIVRAEVRPRMVSSSESRAVRIKTGVRFPGARGRQHAPRNHPGSASSTSSTTASNSACPSRFNAARPSAAVMTRWPSSSSAVSTASRTSGSSSTTRTRPPQNLSRLHQRTFNPRPPRLGDPEDPSTKPKRARRYVTAKPGERATTQAEHRNLSEPHPKLRACLRLRETHRRPTAWPLRASIPRRSRFVRQLGNGPSRADPAGGRRKSPP